MDKIYMVKVIMTDFNGDFARNVKAFKSKSEAESFVDNLNKLANTLGVHEICSTCSFKLRDAAIKQLSVFDIKMDYIGSDGLDYCVEDVDLQE